MGCLVRNTAAWSARRGGKGRGDHHVTSATLALRQAQGDPCSPLVVSLSNHAVVAVTGPLRGLRICRSHSWTGRVPPFAPRALASGPSDRQDAVHLIEPVSPFRALFRY